MKGLPFKKYVLYLGGFLVLYALLHLPMFFLYPNYNTAVRMNITENYFHELADTLQGDCYRISNSFSRECPFPTREVHLSSEHTLVEIRINDKWYAYDPLFKRFFDKQNVAQISFDVNRNYKAPYLEGYKYKESFRKIYYYHNWYFILLKKINPWYNRILISIYDLSN